MKTPDAHRFADKVLTAFALLLKAMAYKRTQSRTCGTMETNAGIKKINLNISTVPN